MTLETRGRSLVVKFGLVNEHFQTFQHVAAQAGGVPHFVRDAFERYQRCGVLAHGFARFQCGSCGYDH